MIVSINEESLHKSPKDRFGYGELTGELTSLIKPLF